jgi:hypothetical protein
LRIALWHGHAAWSTWHGTAASSSGSGTTGWPISRFSASIDSSSKHVCLAWLLHAAWLSEPAAADRLGIGFGWLQNAWLRRMPA